MKDRSPGRMMTAYRPSEPHGWPASPGQALGVTIGGHVAGLEFTYDGRSFRISLLDFGQAGDASDPVYEAEPSDDDIAFEETLTDTFGEHYSFRAPSRRGDGGIFRVRSYSVFVNQESELYPLTYGADLYVVYEPDHRLVHPADQGALLWVRVTRREQRAEATVSYVDGGGGTHPFTATGGRTSIFGEQVVNVDYVDSVERFPGAPDDPGVTPERFLAEVFLVRDTHRRDRAGKDVVEVLGGIKYGWQVEEVQ